MQKFAVRESIEVKNQNLQLNMRRTSIEFCKKRVSFPAANPS